MKNNILDLFFKLCWTHTVNGAVSLARHYRSFCCYLLSPPDSSRKTGTESNCNRQVFPLHYLVLMHQVSTHTGSPSFSISKRKQLPKVNKAICLSLNTNKNKPEPQKINSTSIHSIKLHFQKPQEVNFTRNVILLPKEIHYK